MVSLPAGMPLELRLEVFRRINEGGTPLSGQDIRLGYYSESPRVRFVQLAGIYDPARIGAARMIETAPPGLGWPWKDHPDEAETWKLWWEDHQTAVGQTASEMFLWFLVCRCRSLVDRLLEDKKHLQTRLNLTFRSTNEEVLDIVCAQLRHEDMQNENPPILPSISALAQEYFPRFRSWFYKIVSNCPGSSNVQRYRQVALLIGGMEEVFGAADLSSTQWNWVARFLKASRKIAGELSVDLPESKGRWNTQRAALDAMIEIARAIKKIG